MQTREHSDIVNHHHSSLFGPGDEEGDPRSPFAKKKATDTGRGVGRFTVASTVLRFNVADSDPYAARMETSNFGSRSRINSPSGGGGTGSGGTGTGTGSGDTGTGTGSGGTGTGTGSGGTGTGTGPGGTGTGTGPGSTGTGTGPRSTSTGTGPGGTGIGSSGTGMSLLRASVKSVFTGVQKLLSQTFANFVLTLSSVFMLRVWESRAETFRYQRSKTNCAIDTLEFDGLGIS